MARGQTLGQLMTAVRAEARMTTNAAAGLNSNENIRQVVARIYENLWDQTDWPHLEATFEIQLQAGQSLYGIPAGVRSERLSEKAGYAYYPGDARRYPVRAKDIGWVEYNELEPSIPTQRLDPMRFWCIRPDDMIEVWPVPATGWPTTQNSLFLRGIRNVEPLVDDADICELDGRLVSLFAAAELMGDKGQPKLAQAQTLLGRLTGKLNKRRTFSMLDGQSGPMSPRRIEVIYTRAG